MKPWGIVPVKPIRLAKTRLSALLSPAQRADLVMHMLDHTLQVMNVCDFLAGFLLVSADPAVWRAGREAGAEVLEEPDTPGLNRSLNRARERLIACGAGSIMVVAADLPNLDPGALQQVYASIAYPQQVIIAPDEQRQGTNVLCLIPPPVIPFRFGAGSFARHTQEANKAGAFCSEVYTPNLAFDLDRPEDLNKAAIPGFSPAGLPANLP